MDTTLSRKELEQRRFWAMALLDRGQSQSEVARMSGVTPSAVSQWEKKYRRGGAETLKARVHPGPEPKLTDKKLQRLEKILLKGPRKHGYATELWTLQRVAEVIEEHFGTTYDLSGVWHVLRRMGWSCQKPERRARERDEDAIVRWRKQDWPRIKKSKAERK